MRHPALWRLRAAEVRAGRTGVRMQTSLEWRVDPRRLLTPAGMLAAISNLLPIVGVLAWGWDVFLVLVLYWFETVAIAFMTVLRVAYGSPEEAARFTDESGRAWSSIPLALFFTLHSGIFITVHFIFLWTLFSGDWPQRIHGVGDLVSRVVVHTGLWLPLLCLVAMHGLNFLRQATGRDPLRSAARALLGDAAFAPEAAAQPQPVSLGPLYVRIFAMQIAIIFGGMLAMTLGSMAPLLILIVIKTVVDAGAVMLGDEKPASQ
jgi:hypothetical protein